MNGIYGISDADAYDDAFDDAYDDAFDDAYDDAFEEARRRRGRRPAPKPVGTAPRGTAYQPRPNNSPVTQAQLQAALARVGQQINVNSTAIKTVDGRTRGIVAEQGRLTAGIRKELADRKRDILAVRRDLQATREAGAIMPLLSVLAPASPIAAFAPMLLLGNDVSADPHPVPGVVAPAPAPSGGMLGGLGGGGSTGLIMLMALSGALK